ncbi:MAG: acetate/propionate family kinase [Phycisphaerae bacterium]
MSETVLCLNSGSSSIKFQVYDVGQGDALSLRFKGQLEGIGVKPHAVARTGDGLIIGERTFSGQDVPNAESALPRLLMWIRDQLGGQFPIVIGHRVVFGGAHYAAPVVIDDKVIERLSVLVPLMPLHLPPALLPIKAIHERLPDLKQVAVFDTGFHRGHDEIVERLPIPDEFHQEGVRRYGFHGISYEYISRRLPEVAPEVAQQRVVVAHLGSGCSMCAMVSGKSVDCSMGFSALDGLPMGTRPGRLDPGVLLYMLQVKKMTAAQVEKMLFGNCGLKGMSGISNDVRELLESKEPRARMALDYFCLACARMVADLACVLGGLDGLVFTAGVGEHAAPVRAAIASRLAWLGLALDAAANARHGPCISAESSGIACYVVPTNEELMIAQHALKLVRSAR